MTVWPELSMREWNWNVTDSKKKLFSTWLSPDISRWQFKEMFVKRFCTRSICGWNLVQPLGKVFLLYPLGVKKGFRHSAWAIIYDNWMTVGYNRNSFPQTAYAGPRSSGTPVLVSTDCVYCWFTVSSGIQLYNHTVNYISSWSYSKWPLLGYYRHYINYSLFFKKKLVIIQQTWDVGPREVDHLYTSLL